MGRVAAVAIGAVFLVSAVAKLSNPRSWREQATQMGVPPIAAGVVPWLELGLAAVLLAGLRRDLAVWIAAAVLAAFTTLLVVRLAQGRRPPCVCFGSIRSRPIGWHHVGRNLVLIGVALVGALA